MLFYVFIDTALHNFYYLLPVDIGVGAPWDCELQSVEHWLAVPIDVVGEAGRGKMSSESFGITTFVPMSRGILEVVLWMKDRHLNILMEKHSLFCINIIVIGTNLDFLVWSSSHTISFQYDKVVCFTWPAPDLVLLSSLLLAATYLSLNESHNFLASSGSKSKIAGMSERYYNKCCCFSYHTLPL